MNLDTNGLWVSLADDVDSTKKLAAVQKTNLLEEFLEELSFEADLLPLSFKAFEIVTLRVMM